MKPNNFPVTTNINESTEFYTQTGGLSRKFYLSDIRFPLVGIINSTLNDIINFINNQTLQTGNWYSFVKNQPNMGGDVTLYFQAVSPTIINESCGFVKTGTGKIYQVGYDIGNDKWRHVFDEKSNEIYGHTTVNSFQFSANNFRNNIISNTVFTGFYSTTLDVMDGCNIYNCSITNSGGSRINLSNTKLQTCTILLDTNSQFFVNSSNIINNTFISLFSAQLEINGSNINSSGIQFEQSIATIFNSEITSTLYGAVNSVAKSNTAVSNTITSSNILFINQDSSINDCEIYKVFSTISNSTSAWSNSTLKRISQIDCVNTSVFFMQSTLENLTIEITPASACTCSITSSQFTSTAITTTQDFYANYVIFYNVETSFVNTPIQIATITFEHSSFVVSSSNIILSEIMMRRGSLQITNSTFGSFSNCQITTGGVFDINGFSGNITNVTITSSTFNLSGSGTMFHVELAGFSRLTKSGTGGLSYISCTNRGDLSFLSTNGTVTNITVNTSKVVGDNTSGNLDRIYITNTGGLQATITKTAPFSSINITMIGVARTLNATANVNDQIATVAPVGAGSTF